MTNVYDGPVSGAFAMGGLSSMAPSTEGIPSSFKGNQLPAAPNVGLKRLYCPPLQGEGPYNSSNRQITWDLGYRQGFYRRQSMRIQGTVRFVVSDDVGLNAPYNNAVSFATSASTAIPVYLHYTGPIFNVNVLFDQHALKFGGQIVGETQLNSWIPKFLKAAQCVGKDWEYDMITCNSIGSTGANAVGEYGTGSNTNNGLNQRYGCLKLAGSTKGTDVAYGSIGSLGVIAADDENTGIVVLAAGTTIDVPFTALTEHEILDNPEHDLPLYLVATPQYQTWVTGRSDIFQVKSLMPNYIDNTYTLALTGGPPITAGTAHIINCPPVTSNQQAAYVKGSFDLINMKAFYDVVEVGADFQARHMDMLRQGATYGIPFNMWNISSLPAPMVGPSIPSVTRQDTAQITGQSIDAAILLILAKHIGGCDDQGYLNAPQPLLYHPTRLGTNIFNVLLDGKLIMENDYIQNEAKRAQLDTQLFWKGGVVSGLGPAQDTWGMQDQYLSYMTGMCTRVNQADLLQRGSGVNRYVQYRWTYGANPTQGSVSNTATIVEGFSNTKNNDNGTNGNPYCGLADSHTDAFGVPWFGTLNDVLTPQYAFNIYSCICLSKVLMLGPPTEAGGAGPFSVLG